VIQNVCAGTVQLFFSFLHAGSLDEVVDAPASKTPKDDNPKEEVSKRASKNSGAKIEKGDISSEETPSVEDKTIPDKKRKQTDHPEGEFKKIKPTTFDGESRIGEEANAW
jgi:hypothetical protein